VADTIAHDLIILNMKNFNFHLLKVSDFYGT
jgi:hypothetical protein